MMRQSILVVMSLVLSVTNIASADIFGTGENQFTIDFVAISGDASSADGTPIGCDKTFSDPSSDYRIGVHEITNGQWNKFVNAYGTVTGIPFYAYNMSAYYTDTNAPTNNVSWLEAAQFVNWLNTSSGYSQAYKFTGTQGTGDYTFVPWEAGDAGYDPDNPFRNSEAFYFLPTEDEWVKAAYWNGTNLQQYATKPGESLHQGNGVSGTGWNYYDGDPGPDGPDEGPWNVGSGSEELNGTFDMMGNVWEWMESPWSGLSYETDTYHDVRGGMFAYDGICQASSNRGYGASPDCEFSDLGFRVASVPEPATVYVAVDIKPGSCPNPVNVKSKGVLPVAILGSETFDVNTVDIASIQLAAVEPNRSSYEDVAAPALDANECACIEDGPDGYIDLTLKFDTQAILEALGEVIDGEEWILQLTGVLHNDIPIEGADCIVIRSKSKPGK